ncbi:Alpha/beta hydrolase [Rhodovastum atsumiense]|uniref:Alpha/beta hydrolase n=1 Tax=Rhodovastum atsumiense TaxID=504468 RepID=A0A5M6IQV7_9PROT|nr:alpha/beta hydrolase [Rhodovastum atsumiense]KAA5609855.1 alpha/beta hydrolase [Rhodovastum atsumiense]CAH2602450.1 Alpha/beta hydrolase [Rhodovastum atsumiense]
MTIQAEETRTIAVGPHHLSVTRRGSGPSIVLLHGIPTSAYLWREVVPPLVSAGFETITIDLLGYGRSDKPEAADLGLAAQAERVAGVLARLDWPGGTLIGHDIGGGVAQLIALHHPDLVTALVLVDSVLYDSFPEPGIARLKDPAWDAILGAPDFDLKKGFAKGLRRGVVQADRVTPALIDAYERPFAGIEGRRAYLRAARALRTEELASRMDEIERLDVPTLIVWGEDDVFQPLHFGQRLARAMPRARLAILDQAGHFLPEDAPGRLVRRILDFLQGGSVAA